MNIEEQDYEQAVELLDSLIDVVGENENHPLASLMELVGVLIEQYEDAHVPEIEFLNQLQESKPQKESLAAAFDLLAQMPEDFMTHRQDDLPQERDEWL